MGMQLEKVADAVVLRMQAGKANAIGPAWLARMETLLDEALATRPRALVITGYEGFFSAGLDLPALDALPPEAFAAVKRAIRAPVAQHARDLMTEDAANWAGTWSSNEGRSRRRQAIERLSRKK